MARKPKKRKYTKRAAFWSKPVSSYINKRPAAFALYKEVAKLTSKDSPRHCIRAFDRRGDAAKFGQPYVCATCGEWHARLRA